LFTSPPPPSLYIYINNVLLQLNSAENYSIFLCLQNLLVFLFAFSLVVSIIFIIEKEFVES